MWIELGLPFHLVEGLLSVVFVSGRVGGLSSKCFNQEGIGFDGLLELFSEELVGGRQLLIGAGELGYNAAVHCCCKGKIVQGFGEIEGRIVTMKVGLRGVDFLLFLEIVILCCKELFEVSPCFVGRCFLVPFFASAIVVS